MSSNIHALPPDIEGLIQADKYPEAIVAIDALLKNDPQNSELLEARKSLLASSQTAGAKPTSPQAIEPPSPPATTQRSAALPPITAKKLELILKDVNGATGDARKAPLLELFNTTEPLVRSHPDITSLWAMRGLASLELSKAGAAKEAGANLLRLGADKNGDEQTLAVMAMLSRKRWLMNEQQLAQEKANPPEVELPDKGYFSLDELFSGGPYADYNSHSKAMILRKAQDNFKEAAFYSSAADGVPGPGTQKALLACQNAKSLPASGTLDSATLEALGLTGISQTSAPAPRVEGSAGRSGASRAEKQQEWARLQAEATRLFDLAGDMDRTVSQGKALGRDMSRHEAASDRIFKQGEAALSRANALVKELGLNSSSTSSTPKQKPSESSVNDFRKKASNFDDL